MTPAILYENLMENATSVVASDTGTGYDVTNLYDWNTFDFWAPPAVGTDTITISLPSAVPFDTIGIFAHNLGTIGASYKAEYNAAGWTEAFSAVSPADDSVIIKTFGEQTDDDIRVVIDSTGAPSVPIIGVIAVGKRLDFPVGLPSGFMPPDMASDKESRTNLSAGATFLGRSMRNRAVPFAVPLRLLTKTWVDANWSALRDHIDAKPFFFSWDISDVNAGAFAWTRSPVSMRYSHTNLLGATLPLEGYSR